MPDEQAYKAYRFRLYPKEEQAAYFEEAFRCCRVVYNHFLKVRIDAYEARKDDPSVRIPTRFDMCKLLTSFKKAERDRDGVAYLSKVDSTALVYELKNLDDAFVRFYGRVRKGAADPGFPNFKGRGDKASCTVSFKRRDLIQRNKVKFAKIGWVNAKCWREVEGEVFSCTVTRDASGRWWASFRCRGVSPDPVPKDERELSEKKAREAVLSEREQRLSEARRDPGSDAAIEERRRLRRRRRLERSLRRRQGSRGAQKASSGWKEASCSLSKVRAHERDGLHTQTKQLAASMRREM